METFVAEPRSQLEVCRSKVAESDAVVVIVAHRYGWVPSVQEGGDGRKSVTWGSTPGPRQAKQERQEIKGSRERPTHGSR